MPRPSTAKLAVVLFSIVLLAIIIGEMAVFFFSNPVSHSNTGGKQEVQEGMKCGDWGPLSLAETSLPVAPNTYVKYQLEKVSIYADYVLKVTFTNEGDNPVDLSNFLGEPGSESADMVFLLFNKYGVPDRKTLVIREDSRVIPAHDTVSLLYKLKMNTEDPIYSILVIPKAYVRIGMWTASPENFKGVCKIYSQEINGVKVVERWATLVEGLTVFEAYIDSGKKGGVIGITGDNGLAYTAIIKDVTGETVQVMTSISFEQDKIVVPKDLFVISVSAGQIRGEPSKLELTNSFTVDESIVKDYNGEYSDLKWPDTIPGKWVIGKLEKNVTNGLKIRMTYAYNGYLFVARSFSIINDNDHNTTFISSVKCSPTPAYPVPAIKVTSFTGDSAWVPLAVYRNMSSLTISNGTQALAVTIPAGDKVDSTGWAIVVAPYKSEGTSDLIVKIRLPWCYDISIDIKEIYK